jgi:5-methylcytosine-specific restriction endonuclease McrA
MDISKLKPYRLQQQLNIDNLNINPVPESQKCYAALQHLYQCQYCPQVFSTITDLNIHTIIHPAYFALKSRMMAQHLYQCQYCSQSFYSNIYLNIHLTTHSMYTFINQDNQYLYIFTTGRYSMPFDCRRYNLIYTANIPFESALESNIVNQEDANLRNYLCNYCPETFRKMQHLITHQKIHKHKMYRCEYCG